jgi:small-conductance mechanosensitive channel
MAASQANRKNRVILFVLTTWRLPWPSISFTHFGGLPREKRQTPKIPIFVLAALLGYLVVRALNAAIFDLIFRLRKVTRLRHLLETSSPSSSSRSYSSFSSEACTSNTIGALFTTSAIFGVIIGLALQDTLGNFFAGISLHADRPFQVGDVIVVGSVGVVESILARYQIAHIYESYCPGEQHQRCQRID